MPKALDLTGQRFNRLTVLKRVENSRNGKSQWLCKCDCGNEVIVIGSHLKSGNTKSCGCLDKELIAKRNEESAKDLIGMQFERLTVIAREESQFGKARWLCKCECGNEVVVYGSDLKRGTTKSCGCLKNEMATKRLQDLNEVQKGESHPMYNPNLTDEEREYKRLEIGYTKWAKDVKEQANYTCDCCGVYGVKLHSHHLNDWHTHKELRLDVSNGVCLCESCHKEFHADFMGGYRKECNEQNYLDFKQLKQKALIA